MLVALNQKWFTLKEPTPAVAIPDGNVLTLGCEEEYAIFQSLGGDFTIKNKLGAKFRVEGQYAAALGQSVPAGAQIPDGYFTPDLLEQTLRQCYDPEIPVNILDMGLVYEAISHKQNDGSYTVHIKMTLTAPGCGMGQVLMDDVHKKVSAIEGVSEVKVDLVFDPPWTQAMMTEEARLEAGLL